MNHPGNLQDSIVSIRRRLWLLLLRAFGAVVLLIVVLMLAATFLFLGSQAGHNPFYRAPVAYLLEAYYQGHGSWQGVESLFDGAGGMDLPVLYNEWGRMTLLDASGRVVIDQGQSRTNRVGTLYTKTSVDERFNLTLGGHSIGALVFAAGPISTPLRWGLSLLPSIGVTSILLGFLTLVIGLLLMRRVVDPLAEVIAAAGQVAGGDLGARVPVHKRHDDLHALSASFNQMAQELERSDQQRRAMLADIAHELRTPLTILRGRLEGILDGVYAPDNAHIAPALEEVYLLDRLVDDLRLLTLAEARQLPLEMRPFDLGELAQCAVSTFEAEAAELGIRLIYSNSANGKMVCADSQRIEQVIGNLIGNALRYVPQGGEVNVRLEEMGERLRLSVADDGPGVAEADLPNLFDRFWRGEKSRGRASGGAGLGLAIAKQFIEAQDGEITARNLPDAGFEVWFSLPKK